MAEAYVTFAIAEDVPPEAQQAVLDEVSAIPGVQGVERLLPDASLPELLRLAVATLQPGADPELIAAAVAALPGIAYATVPVDRTIF